ncbi:MAG: putative motility protein [Thermoleophilia bacterium]
MDVSAVGASGAANTLGQVQVAMLRKSMDQALQNNAMLLNAMPKAPAAGSGALVDQYA